VLRRLRREGFWPPLVPTAVLVECITGAASTDAPVNRLIKTCVVREELPLALASRAGKLRASARRGSAVDAVVVASAEPGGAVLTSDGKDLGALSQHAAGVTVQTV
jgi:hypothetical protein